MKKIVRSVSGVACMAGLLGLFGAAGASDRGADIKRLIVWIAVCFAVFAGSAVVIKVTE